jgi:S-adenosylmethionine:diacylglycerol 3-amino-3-carboxypropyl transferase
MYADMLRGGKVFRDAAELTRRCLPQSPLFSCPIGIAGDNVFDYLIEGAKVTAVDFNGAQIALTEIKAAACRLLTFEDFFKIFAKNDMDLFRSHYHQTLRQELTRPSCAFWDKQVSERRRDRTRDETWTKAASERKARLGVAG